MNDGGPAFPVPLSKGWEGMRLRDYFAAKAMMVYLDRISKANEVVGPIQEKVDLYKEIAPCAYEMADAMLREREKQK